MAEIRGNFWFIVGVFGVIYTVWCVWDRTYGYLPTTVRSVHVENVAPVAPGKSLTVSFDLVRRRICKRSFWYILMDREGKRRRFQEPDMDAIGKIGVDSFVQDFPVPDDMKPGPARLRIVWSWACYENMLEAVYPVPLVLDDIHFDIAPK